MPGYEILKTAFQHVILQRLTLADVTGSSLGQLFSNSCFSSHHGRLKFLCFCIVYFVTHA